LSRIYKRSGSPYWWFTSGTPPHRIKKSTGTKDKRVAKLLQDKWDRELVLREQGISVPTVDIIKPKNLYLTEIEANKKPRYAKQVKSTLNVFVDRNPGITNKHLTAFFMQEYFAKCRDLNLSPQTIIHYQKILSNWCNWMMAMRFLTENPLVKLIKPTLIKVRPRKAFTKQEINTALTKARKKKDHLLWSVLYATGLRTADACTITIDDIDGKYIVKSQEKTDGKVVIPIHKDLAKMDIFNIMNPNSTGRSRERLKEILPNGDLHTFRHSFATHLEELGITRWDTKCLLGHKANDVTAQYVKVNVDRLSKYINQLEIGTFLGHSK